MFPTPRPNDGTGPASVPLQTRHGTVPLDLGASPFPGLDNLPDSFSIVCHS